MPSVQIKDVPAETHAVLRRRAAAAHQSLQEYPRAKRVEEATRPTLDEVLDRLDPGPSPLRRHIGGEWRHHASSSLDVHPPSAERQP